MTTRKQRIISHDGHDGTFDCDIINPEINQFGESRWYIL